MKKVLLLVIPLIALFSCGNKLPEGMENMKVEYISRSTIEDLPGYVLVYDVGSGRTFARADSGRHNARYMFKDRFFGNPVRPEKVTYPLLDIMQNPKLADFINENHTGPISEIYLFIEGRHLSTELTALGGSTYRSIPNDQLPEGMVSGVGMGGFFLAIYDAKSEQLHFVDSWVRGKDGDRVNAQLFGHFDSSGTHYYYHMAGYAYKYEVATGTVEPLNLEGYPIVPINSDEVLIVDSESGLLLRLDDNLKVIDSMKVDTRRPQNAYSLGDNRYLIASGIMWNEWPGVTIEVEDLGTGKRYDHWFVPRLKTALYDFSTGKSQQLFESDHGEILNVTME